MMTALTFSAAACVAISTALALVSRQEIGTVVVGWDDRCKYPGR